VEEEEEEEADEVKEPEASGALCELVGGCFFTGEILAATFVALGSRTSSSFNSPPASCLTT
jgi:hypothetical protein